jgi:hypothetical protein
MHTHAQTNAVRRIVPGASEELTAPRKPKASKTAAAKQHKAEVPDIPEYEYELPTESAAGGGGAAQQQQLSAEQQKVRARGGLSGRMCRRLPACPGLTAQPSTLLAACVTRPSARMHT